MKIKYKSKIYKILGIIHKEYKEHDLIVCEVIPHGFKECFQRIDFKLDMAKDK